MPLRLSPVRGETIRPLTEARTGNGVQRFDDDGALLRLAAEHCPTTASTIVTDIRSLLDELGSGVVDDVAVLALAASHSK